MLELKDLTMSYDICLLDHVNYIFPDTGLVGIKGPSGCGKSTLLYCLCGLLKYEGKITFNYKEIDASFCKMIGFIKQNNDLIPSYTVEENIMAGCYFGQIDLNKKKMDKITRRLKIDKLMKRCPNELSIGQMKRVSIARALLKDAPVLLCDEPTGALHYKQAKEVMTLLKEVSEDRLVIVVSHDTELLDEYVDILIEMRNQTLHTVKEGNTNKDVLIPQHKKHFSLRYSFKEVLGERRRLALLSLFQILVIVTSLVIISGLNGLSTSIEKSYMEAPLKDIVTIASHDGESLSLKEKETPHFDIESGYIKGVNAFLIRLPAKKNHIKLLSGRFPHHTNEVIITHNLSHKLKSQFTCHLLEDDTYKVVGVIEDNFYQDQFVCFHHDIDKKYPDLIRDDKMDIITNNPETVIKRYENNYEADNDVYMKKMSYGTLISIGRIIALAYMMISLIVAIELTKTVFSSLYLERSRSLALKISMGATYKQLQCESKIEIFIIGTFIYSISIVMFIIILSILPLTSFEEYFHFTCLASPYYFYVIFYFLYLLILILSASAPFIRIKKESIVSLLSEE